MSASLRPYAPAELEALREDLDLDLALEYELQVLDSLLNQAQQSQSELFKLCAQASFSDEREPLYAQLSQLNEAHAFDIYRIGKLRRCGFDSVIQVGLVH